MDQTTLMLLAAALEKEADYGEDEYIGEDELAVLDNITIGDGDGVMNADGIEKEADVTTGAVVQKVVNALKSYAGKGWEKTKGAASAVQNAPGNLEAALQRGTAHAMPNKRNLRAVIRAAMAAGPAAAGGYYVGKKRK